MVILGITILAAYFFVPPLEASYVTLHLDKYRGVYNSAWVGGSVALSTTLFLTLFGFYLVKNSIQRDERTGVGQIILTTAVKKLYYLIGKLISNFAVLSIIVLVVMIIALIMQLVRGEVMQIELWPLLSPFLFLTLPIMSIVAALAVLFETRQTLQGGIGNIIYFVIFILFSASSSYITFGTAVITSDMVNVLTSTKPDFSGSYGIGFLIPEQPLELFEWQGVDWTGTLNLQQLSLFLFSFLLILVASLLFHGFQEAPYFENIEKKKAKAVQTGLEKASSVIHMNKDSVDVEGKLERSTSRIRASALTPVAIRESFLRLVLAEWRLMMKSASLGWYVVAGILVILCLMMPTATSSHWIIWPVTWIWPLVLWSGIGNREVRFQTQYLIASSPRFVTRQLSAAWAAGFLLACLTGFGMFIRLILEGNMVHLGYWVATAIFIPSFALASGVLTKTNRTFEVLYMIIWYLGPFNKMVFLDFMGANSGEGTSWMMSVIYILISICLLFLAYVSRSRLSQTT